MILQDYLAKDNYVFYSEIYYAPDGDIIFVLKMHDQDEPMFKGYPTNEDMKRDAEGAVYEAVKFFEGKHIKIGNLYDKIKLKK